MLMLNDVVNLIAGVQTKIVMTIVAVGTIVVAGTTGLEVVVMIVVLLMGGDVMIAAVVVVAGDLTTAVHQEATDVMTEVHQEVTDVVMTVEDMVVVAAGGEMVVAKDVMIEVALVVVVVEIGVQVTPHVLKDVRGRHLVCVEIVTIEVPHPEILLIVGSIVVHHVIAMIVSMVDEVEVIVLIVLVMLHHVKEAIDNEKILTTGPL